MLFQTSLWKFIDAGKKDAATGDEKSAVRFKEILRRKDMNAIQNYYKKADFKTEISWNADSITVREAVVNNINRIIDEEKRNGKKEEDVIQAFTAFCKASMERRSICQSKLSVMLPLFFMVFGFIAGYTSTTENLIILSVISYIALGICVMLWLFSFPWQEKAQYQDAFILSILESWKTDNKKPN